MNKIQKTPRVSLNQVLRYNSASSTKRRAIVFQAKKPSDIIVPRYSKARRLAVNYFLSGFDQKDARASIDELKERPADTAWKLSDRDKSVEAVNLLVAMPLDIVGVQKMMFSRYKGDNPKLNFLGTDVSVYPDLVIRGLYRGKQVVGAVKFHFSSGNPMNQEECKTGAVLLYDFAKKHLCREGEEVSPKHCIYIDPFSGVLEHTPSSVVNRMKMIVASCQEFGMWWKTG